MPEVFVISDLHLGHKAALNFRRADGELLRDFPNIDAMHRAIIDGWRSVVTPQDKIYVLGDVAMSSNKIVQGILADLPGKKRLVRGNHDLNKDAWYKDAGFKSLYGVRHINGVWLTHIPVNPQCLGWGLRQEQRRAPRALGNIHGHLHAEFIWNIRPVVGGKGKAATGWKDSRYFNACVEPLGYVPRTIASIVEEMNWEGDRHGAT